MLWVGWGVRWVGDRCDDGHGGCDWVGGRLVFSVLDRMDGGRAVDT